MPQENIWKLIEDSGGFTGRELVVFTASRNIGKTQLTQELVDCYFDIMRADADKDTTALEILKGRE